jgi:hypothetical protein
MAPVTAMGHTSQRRQHIRSTTKNNITSDLEDKTVTLVGLGTQNHLVYAVLIDQGSSTWI